MKKCVFYYVRLTNQLSFKINFQKWKVDHHKGDKWLIHGAKHHMDNQLQSLELPWRIS